MERNQGTSANTVTSYYCWLIETRGVIHGNPFLLSLVFAQVMSFTDEFRGLDRDIEGSPKRWKKLVESECPEKEKFPQDWKGKSSLQKLIMMRALRPDRMTYAVRCGGFFFLLLVVIYKIFLISS